MFKYLDQKFKIRRKVIVCLAKMHFWGNPSRKMKVVGVTGTNGKTTIAILLYKLFSSLGYNTGFIGTEGVKACGKDLDLEFKSPTTPGARELNKIFREFKKLNCEYVFMEVSSHAMDQNRIAGINFAGGIFTNLTQDHLDYHKDFEHYFKAKKKFFKRLSKKAFALTNVDDEYGHKMIKGIKAKKETYGFKNKAKFSEKIESKLIGKFNEYNLLAVYVTAILLGEEDFSVKMILKNLEGAEGRFQVVKGKEDITGIVDFAHTPDALSNVLQAINDIKGKGKLIAVFGCGGDRDSLKRPLMMQIVYELSDIIIATSDNPRSEEIRDIFEDMKKGLPNELSKPVHFIESRIEAISKAYKLAKEGDYILLAGKGHEKYQEIKGVKYPFSDMEELKKHVN